MTRKHYKNLAESLGVAIGQHSDGTPEREEFASDMLEAVMDSLASENPRFSRGKFARAVQDQALATRKRYEFAG
jgi:hypothetical protein